MSATMEASVNTGKQVVVPVFSWDDYTSGVRRSSERWAHTDRGWCHFAAGHPDGDDAPACCGNYLRYLDTRGPGGEEYHAVAYVIPHNRATVGLGFAWFASVAECKEFIEGNVRSYLGLPREVQS